MSTLKNKITKGLPTSDLEYYKDNNKTERQRGYEMVLKTRVNYHCGQNSQIDEFINIYNITWLLIVKNMNKQQAKLTHENE